MKAARVAEVNYEQTEKGNRKVTLVHSGPNDNIDVLLLNQVNCHSSSDRLNTIIKDYRETRTEKAISNFNDSIDSLELPSSQQTLSFQPIHSNACCSCRSPESDCQSCTLIILKISSRLHDEDVQLTLQWMNPIRITLLVVPVAICGFADSRTTWKRSFSSRNF